MNFLFRRLWLLAGTATLVAGGALGAACSSPEKFPDGGGPDAQGDNTVPTDGSKPDGGPQNDGGPQQTCEAGIDGTCDIVAQNCGAGKECTLIAAADGGYSLGCVANATGSIKEGYACTQSGSSNPCVAGLECIQDRCSKHCCSGDNQACDTSHPEGFQGKCELNITLPKSSTVVYTVCTYNKPCEPFQIQGCGPNLTCLVGDNNGTANCYDYSNGGDAGSAEKATCTAGNECNDGMGCYGALDGGASTCQWNCYNKGQGGPYDNQIGADAGAGFGGCPTKEKCVLINWGGSLPAWFGLCQ